jgi:K+/H+ antiporter YhaU regulatory subunit KhtT
MTIVAIVRDDDAIVAPEPTEVLRPGDRVVVVGRPDDLDGVVRTVGG